MSLKCFWQNGFGWEPRALAPGLEILPLEDKARIENKKRIQKKKRYAIRDPICLSSYDTTVALLPTFPAEPTYVREFRDFIQVTRTAVRNLPAHIYVIGLGSLCYRLIMFTALSINIK